MYDKIIFLTWGIISLILLILTLNTDSQFSSLIQFSSVIFISLGNPSSEHFLPNMTNYSQSTSALYWGLWYYSSPPEESAVGE